MTTLEIKGDWSCETSRDGVTFVKLKPEDILNEGSTVRTGPEARVDLFFRRVGITVRLQERTELALETMTHSSKDGVSDMRTLLDLRKGRIFTVVRTLVSGCTFEVRNAAGRSVVEGSGSGRYIITADGTQVADTDSKVPLRVIGDTGITIIRAGQSYRRSEGKMLPVTTPDAVLTMIELDELRALADAGGVVAVPAVRP